MDRLSQLERGESFSERQNTMDNERIMINRQNDIDNDEDSSDDIDSDASAYSRSLEVASLDEDDNDHDIGDNHEDNDDHDVGDNHDDDDVGDEMYEPTLCESFRGPASHWLVLDHQSEIIIMVILRIIIITGRVAERHGSHGYIRVKMWLNVENLGNFNGGKSQFLSVFSM